MKFIFIGVPGEDHQRINMFGTEFALHESVEVGNPFVISKLKNHRHFRIDAEEAKIIEPKKPEQAPPEEEKAEVEKEENHGGNRDGSGDSSPQEVGESGGAGNGKRGRPAAGKGKDQSDASGRKD